MTVNLKLDRKRAEAGLTYRQLAARANLRPTTLSRIVNGCQHPQRRTVANLCDILSCAAEDIGFDSEVCDDC